MPVDQDYAVKGANADEPPAAKPPRAKKAKPNLQGQREMLLPIIGNKAADAEEKTPVQTSSSRRKAG